MNGYAVVSSVRLRGSIYPTFGLRLAWLSRPNPIHEPSSIVYFFAVVNRPSDENYLVQGDPF